MSKSYEERMAEKYNFLKKDNDKAPEISEKNLQNNPDISENDTNNEESLLAVSYTHLTLPTNTPV